MGRAYSSLTTLVATSDIKRPVFYKLENAGLWKRSLHWLLVSNLGPVDHTNVAGFIDNSWQSADLAIGFSDKIKNYSGVC